MEKENPIHSTDDNKVEEPAIEYQRKTKITVSPALTEEEMKNALTGEELLERVIPRIKKLFE